MAEEQKTGCSPSDSAGCSHAGECGSKPQSLIKPENKISHINHVIAVVSGKGGVGKSTTVVNLAAVFGLKGKIVLIVDFDPQGNTTTSFGIKKKSIRNTVFDVIFEECSIFEAVVPTS